VIRVGVIGAGDGGEEILGSCEAVVIASPLEERFHHTALALEAGLDVLVEQPVAPTVENARMLERIARLRPVPPVVQVSQPDHFNPALRTLDGETPLAIDFRRRGSSPDAMLHDVHTLVRIARSPLIRVQASGDARYAVATLTFESGLIATLAAGEAGPSPAHEVVATTADSVIAIDALTGDIEVTRAGVRERTRVELGDPLATQEESFLDAVRERGRPAVGLRTAIACQEVVAKVSECLAVQAAATGVATS
jgi:predicted dehydrogenase